MNLGTDKLVYPWTFDIPGFILEIKSVSVSEDLTESGSVLVASSVLEIGSNFFTNKTARAFSTLSKDICVLYAK